ncbi:MAG: GlsB/YeaQ/YmgE family stress response membrane protein [Alphaproteobacteria bacterium]|nr:GlsB/YeaQ/YmgE family stress response membrane protein [Alphaproteobacteria bacterium]
MVDFLIVIAIGFLVGLVARFLTPGRDPGGIIVTIVIGIVGSIAATYGGRALGLYAPGQVAGFIGSVIGAIVLLVLLRLIRRG